MTRVKSTATTPLRPGLRLIFFDFDSYHKQFQHGWAPPCSGRPAGCGLAVLTNIKAPVLKSDRESSDKSLVLGAPPPPLALPGFVVALLLSCDLLSLSSCFRRACAGFFVFIMALIVSLAPASLSWPVRATPR